MTSTPRKDTFTKSIFNTAISYPGFENLVTEEVEVPGHDGTMIPLSIIHRKDLKLDGSSSAILEGYGAYGISYTPGFNVRHSIALHGVVLAYAHVRGGSEKGEAWYKAGYKTTKPNTWKDFISSAEYLIKKGYTSADKLAGTGTSAGGILISRAVTERPDLFAAIVCNVGVANALRVEFSPNGPVNTPEFGTVQDATRSASVVRNGRRPARQSRRQIPRGAWRRRLERSARRAVAAGKVRRRDAGGQHVRQAGAARRSITTTATSRRRRSSRSGISPASSHSCSGRRDTRSFNRRRDRIDGQRPEPR